MFVRFRLQLKTLGKLVDSFKELLSDVIFDCSSSGIKLTAMDNSHVSLVDMKLKASGFEEFECPREFTMALSLINFTKILKTGKPTDSVCLQVDEKNADKVVITFITQENRFATYEMRLMEIQRDHIEMEQYGYDCSIKMASDEYLRICRSTLQFSETTTVECLDEESVSFSTPEEEGLRSSVRLTKVNVIFFTEPIKQVFSTKYLVNFGVASSLASEVIMNLTRERPLVVSYIIEKLGELNFYLAPKITDEDDQ